MTTHLKIILLKTKRREAIFKMKKFAVYNDKQNTRLSPGHSYEILDFHTHTDGMLYFKISIPYEIGEVICWISSESFKPLQGDF